MSFHDHESDQTSNQAQCPELERISLVSRPNNSERIYRYYVKVVDGDLPGVSLGNNTLGKEVRTRREFDESQKIRAVHIARRSWLRRLIPSNRPPLEYI